jgi:hypothetical protein
LPPTFFFKKKMGLPPSFFSLSGAGFIAAAMFT